MKIQKIFIIKKPAVFIAAGFIFFINENYF